MLVWGGNLIDGSRLNTGGRYNPETDTWSEITTNGAPSPRSYHTTVWTGSEMIVWGGNDGSSRFNTGGRYNPVTGTWTNLPTANAPAARNAHAAVWTGSEMIVWGGFTSDQLSSAVNTGGRYNPATDTWAPVSTASAPSARADSHTLTAVWSGSEMIVWGGVSANSEYLNTGGRYNPTADAWVTVSLNAAPSGRDQFESVWTGDTMILFGGFNGSYLSDPFSYTPPKTYYLYQRP